MARHELDVVIVGSGVAGLSAALAAAPARVTLLTKGRFGAGNSTWAQGGMAVALADGDSPELHAHDTVAVGAGLNDADAVRVLTTAGPERARLLLELGARIDRDPDGRPSLGREAAHSTRRILHAADATGAELVRTLCAAVRTVPSIVVVEEAQVLDLLVHDGTVVGVVAALADGRVREWRAPAVILATGGTGQLFAATTNPPEATADGQALAARAGAVLRDLEFVQFHPTALAAPGADPLPLVTEALRGEGATIVDETGRRFVFDSHPDGELAPRDVVARAVARHRLAGHVTFLDARLAVGARFPERFPTVFASCRRYGIDPRVEPVPVSPAAHYHMGGVATDLVGATSRPGLWAAGEVAATGVHGANRLASNSLLEALVFGARTGHAAVEAPSAAGSSGAANGAPPSVGGDRTALAAVRRTMWEQVGLERTGDGLAHAVDALERLAGGDLAPEVANLALVGRLVATAALERTESRGAHHRADHPGTDPSWARHIDVTLVGGAVVTTLRPAGVPA